MSSSGVNMSTVMKVMLINSCFIIAVIAYSFLSLKDSGLSKHREGITLKVMSKGNEIREAAKLLIVADNVPSNAPLRARAKDWKRMYGDDWKVFSSTMTNGYVYSLYSTGDEGEEYVLYKQTKYGTFGQWDELFYIFPLDISPTEAFEDVLVERGAEEICSGIFHLRTSSSR